MRSMNMGPKLLAAFGAGMMIASIAFYVASLRRLAEPASPIASAQPETIPTVVPPIETPPAQSPPAQPPRRKQRPMVVNTVQPAPSPPPPPAPPIIVAAEVPLEDPKIDATSTSPSSQAIDPALIVSPEFPLPPLKTATLPSGTLIQIRLSERLATDRNLAGDAFAAVLDQELVADGWVIAEAGSRVLGKLVELNKAGRVKGTASMTLALTSITISDGQKIPIHTSGFLRKGDSSHGDDAGKIALGSAIGAVIGAAAGGGKGAAIGAASGGATGVGTVLATRGKAAVLEAETRLSFRLDDQVTITERR